MGCRTEKAWKNDSEKFKDESLRRTPKRFPKQIQLLFLLNLQRLIKIENYTIPLRPELNFKTALNSEKQPMNDTNTTQRAAASTTLTLTEPQGNTEARSSAAFFLFACIKKRKKKNNLQWKDWRNYRQHTVKNGVKPTKDLQAITL